MTSNAPHLPLPPLARNTIFAVCGQRSAARGLNYFRQGRVGPLCFDSVDGNLVVSATVRGSGRNEYDTAVTLLRTGRTVHLMGECTCPMYRNCKHVAAVCFAYRHQRQEQASTATDPVQQWLARLSATQRPAAPPASPQALLYLLAPDRDHALRVTTVLCRRLKRGGYGKPRPYRLGAGLHAYLRPDFFTETDANIATLLAPQMDNFYEETGILQGELGLLALERMIRSGRCHWKTPQNPPLRPGAPIPLALAWRETPRGQRLVPELPEGLALYLVHEPLAIDPHNHQCHRLQGGPDGATLAALLDAPPLPREALPRVSEALVLDFPQLELPVPVPTEARRERLTGPPGPVLHLCRETDGPRRYVELRFRYGPLEFAPTERDGATAYRREGKVAYVVARDLQAEEAAARRLTDEDLVPVAAPDLPAASFTLPAELTDDRESALTQWLDFQENTVPRLRADGWEVVVPDTLTLRVSEAGNWQAELAGEGGDWFSLSLGVEVDGKIVNLLPVILSLLRSHRDPQSLRQALAEREHVLAPLDEGHYLRLPSDLLAGMLDTLLELHDGEPLDEDGRLPLSRHAGAALGELLNDPRLSWRGADELRALGERLARFEGLQPVAPPAGLRATLRGYQRQGLAWLQFLRELDFNGVLADDMGLGKTIQTLAHLLAEKEAGRLDRPALVVAPTSLMGNWRREAERFTPDLRVLVLHGPERRRHFDRLAEYDLILTTYPLVVRDEAVLREQPFHYVVLDEAQAIKNPRAKTAQAVCRLDARHRLCLTGTPLENHLGELWSLFHFLMPGFLGPLERFNRLFRNPVERGGDDLRLEQLRRRVKPFLLRRTKEAVAAELPPKTEIVRSVALHGRQRELYESIRLAMDEKVRAEIRRKGLARSQIMILDALLKLRQVCCDPRLVRLARAEGVHQSAKLDLLMEILPEMVEEGRRILLFSQFTRMLGLIEAELKKRRIGYTKLTGQTRKRQEAIDRFQDGQVPVFLISLKAGGTGLNLTAADTVIHYDPWWNPAVERQATDRAHRIGQDKHVFVYKLVTEDTVEERILALQQKKQALADGMYSGGGQGPALSAEDLMALLEPLG